MTEPSDRRPDHFAHLKQAPAAPLPTSEQPTVRPDLVEYLEREFPEPTFGPATSMDDAVGTVTRVAERNGERRVIEAIRQLIRGA